MTEIFNLKDNYSPENAASEALKNALVVTNQGVKGAHDAHFTVLNGKAYVVYECNDQQAGEDSRWDFIYCAMSVVDLATNTLERVLCVSHSEQQFDNEKLIKGCTFVSRIIALNDRFLRVIFSSESPETQPSITYYRDFDTKSGEFESSVHRLKLKTNDGIVDFCAESYNAEAIKAGINCPKVHHSAYLFDIFDACGKKYVALNNFSSKQNALAVFNDELDCLEIIGHIESVFDKNQFSEAGIAFLPNGTLMAILRDDIDLEYGFSYSEDGKKWSAPTKQNFCVGGTNSKPTLNNFFGTIFMGWNAGNRKIFNLDCSTDGKNFKKLFKFNGLGSFQYPTFVVYENEIYFTATQGAKEQIIFGKLPLIYKNGKFYLT